MFKILFLGNLGMTEIFIVFIFFPIIVLPRILFLLTLKKVLTTIKIENRKLTPNLVWLNLIPVFDLFWKYITIIKISESLDLEFKFRSYDDNELKSIKNIGLLYCSLIFFLPIPHIGIIFGIAYFVVWIIYWVKINTLVTLLKRNLHIP